MACAGALRCEKIVHIAVAYKNISIILSRENMLMGLHRVANWAWRHKIPVLPKLIYVFNRVIFSIVLPPSANIGKNVILGYRGLGIVIHGRAIIEDGVTVGTGVVIGGRSGLERVPVIREGALLGTGCKILGPVVVGRYAKIGANAVVLEDVPDGGVAVGVPARLVRVDSVPE